MKNRILLLFILLTTGKTFCQNITFMPPTLSEIEQEFDTTSVKNKNSKVLVFGDDRELYVFFGNCKVWPCSMDSLESYIAKNIKYPDSSYKAGIEGTVVVSFSINQQGKIGDVKILKHVSPDIDNEVLTAISNMPDWNWDARIKLEQRPIAHRKLPIMFTLEKEKKED